MIQEFKSFIMRGNVVDLAVAVIMGAAFGAIVTSLVNDVVMPPIGILTGGIDFGELYINLSGADYPSLAAAQEAGAATINYGQFINTVINFLVVAAAIFVMIRILNKAKRKEEAVPDTPPPRPPQEVLLEEIRDLLKQSRV